MEKREESEKKREDQRRERVGRKQMQVREKSRKVAIHNAFLVICGSGGSKSRHAEAAGAETSGQMRNETCTPLRREAHFQVKMHKQHQGRTAFGS